MASYFANSQWTVTDYGLEAGPEAPLVYEIEASRLLKKTERGAGTVYDWPVHMAEKTWINYPAFEEAFRKALKIHAGKYKDDMDAALLEKSFVEGRKEVGK